MPNKPDFKKNVERFRNTLINLGYTDIPDSEEFGELMRDSSSAGQMYDLLKEDGVEGLSNRDSFMNAVNETYYDGTMKALQENARQQALAARRAEQSKTKQQPSGGSGYAFGTPGNLMRDAMEYGRMTPMERERERTILQGRQQQLNSNRDNPHVREAVARGQQAEAEKEAARLSKLPTQYQQQHQKFEEFLDRFENNRQTEEETQNVQNYQQQALDEFDYENATGQSLHDRTNLVPDLMTQTVARDENGNVIVGADGKPLISYSPDTSRRQASEDLEEQRTILDTRASLDQEMESGTLGDRIDKAYEMLDSENPDELRSAMNLIREIKENGSEKAKALLAQRLIERMRTANDERWRQAVGEDYERLMENPSQLGNITTMGALSGGKMDPLQVYDMIKGGKTSSYEAVDAILTEGERRLKEWNREQMEAEKDDIFNKYIVRNATQTLRGITSELFSVSNWDNGRIDANKNNAVLSASRALEDAGGDVSMLDDSQRNLLEAEALKNYILGNYEVSTAYGTVGQTTGAMAPFVTQMALGSMAGVANKTQALGRLMSWGAASKWGKKAWKFGGRLAGDMLEAGLTTMVVQNGQVAANAAERAAGQVQGEIGDNGQMNVTGVEGSKGILQSFGEAALAQYIENLSERASDYMHVGGITKGLAKMADKYDLTLVNRAVAGAKKSDLVRMWGNMTQKMHFGSLPEEFAEEMIGGTMNALTVGDQSLGEVWDPVNMAQTALALSLSCGAMTAIAGGHYIADIRNAKSNMRKADQKAATILGDKWEGVKAELDSALDNGAEGGADAAVANIMQSGELTEPQKLAAINYAQRHEYYRGLIYGTNAAMNDKDTTPEERQVLASEIRGEDLEGKERNEAAMELEDAQNNLREVLGLSDNADLDAAIGLTNGRTANQVAAMYARNGENDGQKQAVLDYLNARAAYEGIMQRVEDDVDTEVTAAETQIDQRMNQEGNVQSATMKADDRQVYVVSGDVVMTDDGTMVNTGASSESVVVRDAATGKLEMVSPKDILSVAEAVPAEQLKQEAAQNIENEIVEKAAADVEGRLSFEPGSTFTLEIEPGQPVDLTVVGRDEAGNVVVESNGQQAAYSEQMLQNLYDNYNRAQHEQRKAQQQAEAQAAQEGQQDASEEPAEGTQQRQPSALERIETDPETGAPMIERAPDAATGYDALTEYLGDAAEAADFAATRAAALQQEADKAKKAGDLVGYRAASQAARTWQGIVDEHNARQQAAQQQAAQQNESETTEARQSVSGENATKPGTDITSEEADLYIGEEQRKELEKVAEALGIKIRFVINAPGVNAYIETGGRTMVINVQANTGLLTNGLNAKQAIFGHELMHSLKESNPEAYNKLRGLVENIMGSEAWNQAIAKTMRAYKPFVYRTTYSQKIAEGMTEEQAVAEANKQAAKVDEDFCAEEVVCDAAGAMIFSNDILKDYAARLDHPTLAAILQWISDAIDKIRGKIKGTPVLSDLEQAVSTIREAMDKRMDDVIDETARREGIEKETARMLAEHRMTMEGGAPMSQDAARLKAETGYQTPNERDVETEKFSIPTIPGWADNYRRMPNSEERVVTALNNWAQRVVASEIVSETVSMGDYGSQAPKSGRRAKGNGVGPLRTNDEYVLTFDMDTTCPRTFQYLNYTKQIEQKIGRPLTQKECIQLIEQMRAYGQQIPCVYCYAENKRQALKQYFLNFMEARHAVLSTKDTRKAKQLMYGQDGKGGLTKAAATVFKEWRRMYKEGNPYNPTMRELWMSFNNSRNSLFTVLDQMASEGVISRRTKDADILKAAVEHFGITDKRARSIMESLVVEWRLDAIEQKPHQDFKESPVPFVDENAMGVWRDMVDYSNSASQARGVLRYVPYTDELKYVSQEDKDYINGMGGLRMHSSNDFRIDYVTDYFQLIADMAANGWMGHTYTKNPDFVRIFGHTGYRINMSIAAYGGENGTAVVMNEEEGFNWEEARRLREAYPNAGTMWMVVNDAQLEMALNSDWVDMIIPFHASGLPREVWYNMRMWDNYTATQNETFYNSTDMKKALKERGVEVPKKASAAEVKDLFNKEFGIIEIYDKDGKRIRPHFLPGDTVVDGHVIPGHGNSVERYLELCRQYGVHPRFWDRKAKDKDGVEHPLPEHPGYLKVIKETARTDSEQTPIQFNLDQYDEFLGKTSMEYAWEALEGFAKIGGYENLKEDPYGIVQEFLKEFIGKERPLDYITPLARETWKIQKAAIAEALDGQVPYHPEEGLKFSISEGVESESVEAIDELNEKGVSVDNPGLLKEYGLKSLTLQKSGDIVKLSKIVADEQGKGNGTRFMNALTDIADKNGWTLALTPDTSFGGSSVSRLKKFYNRFGFKDNKGRNTNFATRESMVREPDGGVRFSVAEPVNSKEFKEWFGDSKVVDKKGKPKVMWHGTKAMFNTFRYNPDDIGFHFGNKSTARARVGRGKDTRLLPVYIRLSNPIELTDDLGAFDGEYLAPALLNKGIITEEEYNNVWFKDGWKRGDRYITRDLRTLLLSKGYDGISYPNYYESDGSTSYIVFEPNQVKLADETTYDNNGNPIPASERFNNNTGDIRYSLQGLDGYTEKDVTDQVRDYVGNIMEGEDFKIKDMRVIGSRTTGTAREDSDLDVLVEYTGSVREDDAFNALNDEENRLYIEGIPVDINPITRGKSGTIEQFMERNRGFSKMTPEEKEEAGVRFSLSTEIEAKYPNWMDNQTPETEGKRGQNTQVAGTVGTYKKVGKWVEDNMGKDAKILDASSGLGLGTLELRKQGFDVEDIEPYPGKERDEQPTYGGLGAYQRAMDDGKEYDYIISNAVLNVIPDDWRDGVLHDMAVLMKPGGKMFINTRKAGEEKTIKNKIELESPQEVLVGTPEKITSYQRFFTPNELKEYVERELGDGYTVVVANEKNSGTKGLAAVVVTKEGNDGARYSISEKAVESFGTTAKWSETGWLTPDGQQLDFSDGQNGTRGADHRAIGRVMDNDYDDRWMYLRDYENEGGIRVHYDGGYGLIEMAKKPTREQRSKLGSLIRKANGNVDVDFMDENYDNVAHAEYAESTSAQRITADIDRFYDEGIRPEGTVKYSVSDTFYSPAERAVEGIKQNKATGEQWLKMIEKAGGLKKEEDKWMGLSDFLKGKKSVTKDELLDFIRENQVQVEDVHYSEYIDLDNNSNMRQLREEFDDSVEKFKQEKEAVDAEMIAFNDEMYGKYGEEWSGKLSAADKERGDKLQARYNRLTDDPKELAFNEMVERYGDDFGMAFEVNWGNGKLEPQMDMYGDDISDAAKYFLQFEEQPINSTRLSYTTRGLDNKREIALVVPTVESWNESDQIHFGDAGDGRAVAWARFGDTTDKDDKKVLVIDEIQSKRHQEGREKGYKENLSKEDLQKRYDDAVEAFEKFKETHDLSVENADVNAEYFRLKNEVYAARGDLNGVPTPESNSSKVPDAPFQKNWHELAMKRMLRLAAEEGYDKIAWTKGEQQAERYNLAKTIPSITRQDTKKAADRGIKVFAMDINGEPEKVFVDNDGTITNTTLFMDEVSGKPLSDFVGKDIAIRMMSMNDGEIIDTSKEKIGGEGMKGFYDEMLPRFMNKYGKKWGVKVGEVELPNLEEAGRKMWSVDVTPEMKESVMQGQPKFSISPQHEPFKLSDEKKDADGNRMYERNGSIDLWSATALLAKARRQQAPVRLSERNMKHIISNHSDRLYSEEKVFEFLDNVFANATKLRKARGRGMFVVVENDNTDNVALIKLMPSEDSDYYNVDTAGYYRKSKWKDSEEVIADLSEPSQSDAAADASKPQVPYENGGEPINAEAQVSSSEDKDTKNIDTLQENNQENAIQSRKQAQFDVIQRENPKDPELNHTWVESVDDIKTFDEAFEGYDVNEDLTPDYTSEMAKKARETGKVTVYSSHEIADGAFVTPSRMEAQNYAGEGKVYSKTVPVDDVAWIDPLQGQYAKVDGSQQRYSVSAEEDKAYMDAVNAGDMETAQQMVRDAAALAGYNSKKLYHGSDAFGFTSIDTNRSDDGASFWATDKEDVAGSYTKLAITRKPGAEINDDDYDKAVAKANDALDDGIREFRHLIDKHFSEWFFGQQGDEGIRKVIMDANHEPGYGDGVYDVLEDYVAEAYDNYGEDFEDKYEDFADWEENSPEAQEIFDAVNSLEGLRDQVWQLENGELSGGIYELYSNTDNMFVVDAKGKAWNELHPEGLPKIVRGQYKDVPYRTRDVVEWAKENGYDGVIFKNIRDNGRYGRTESSDVYAFINPQEQIKSADPVTYDDEGNVIPLSERFNPENNDIRFSLGDDIEDEEERTDDSLIEGVTPEMVDGMRQEISEERPHSLNEAMDEALLKLANQHEENVGSRKNALDIVQRRIREILEAGSGSEENAEAGRAVRSAARAQRRYDEKTVNALTNFVRSMIRAGYLDNVGRGTVTRLLAAVKNSVGSQNIDKQVEAILDEIAKNQIREAKRLMKKVTTLKGSKINASGVEVQGKLDVRGQNILKAYKEGLKMDAEQIEERIGDIQERMDRSEDETVKAAARAEMEGMLLAQQYAEQVKQKADDLKQLQHDLRHADEELGDKMSKEDLRSYKQELKANILQAKIDLAQAYADFLPSLTGSVKEGIDRAKEWEQQELDHKQEIYHMANSDTLGLDSSPIEKKSRSWKNNFVLRFLFSPVATFQTMLGAIAGNAASGRGYLYNYFMPRVMEASNKAFLGKKAATDELDEKVSDVFGREMRWSDLFRLTSKDGMMVEFFDKEDYRTEMLTQGNLMYIYMVNKMSDGKMKLRKMGISEEDVANIEEHLDPRLLELADWIQNEFLVKLRNKYNAVHEEVFGASMAAIEDYFPLKIASGDRYQEVDLGKKEQDNGLSSTVTGSVIKRTKNTKLLDILNADAADVVLEHIEQMEEWAAYAKVRKDMNTLLSYGRFRNKLSHMDSTLFGSGDAFWEAFKNVASLAVGTYRPRVSRFGADNFIAKVASGVTGAKIAFRMYTALKQVTSFPAFIQDVNPATFAWYGANPMGSYQWAMDHLPSFKKRVQSRAAGDTRLMLDPSHLRLTWEQALNTLQRWGMAANATVDAVTCAIGARAVYDAARKRYLDYGYSEEEAERKATKDAETAFNESQQSNEGAFVSPIQRDRTAEAIAFTVYRNSSMAYGRNMMTAARRLWDKMSGKEPMDEQVEYMAKMYERDGLTEEQAKRAAKKEYMRSIRRDAIAVANYGFVLPFIWTLAGSLPYIIFSGLGGDGGDDDKDWWTDEKKEMIADALKKELMHGSIEGLAGGNVMATIEDALTSGDTSKADIETLPVKSDIRNMLKTLSSDPVRGYVDIFNIAVQAGLGVNPKTITDAVAAVDDAMEGDLGLEKEFWLAFMRINQVPAASVDNFYIDELQMTARDAKKQDIEKLANRWAEYRANRNQPYAFLESDAARNERIEKQRKTALAKMKERNFYTVDEQYKTIRKRVTEMKKQADQMVDAAGTQEEKQNLIDEFKRQPLVTEADSLKGHISNLKKLRKLKKGITNPDSLDVIERHIQEEKGKAQAILDAYGKQNEALYEANRQLEEAGGK